MKVIPLNELDKNVFSLYKDDWALLSAGNNESFNTMTVSWGGFGFLWNKPVVYSYVRPTRFTYEFTEKHDYFTLTFLKDGYREDLAYLGKASGRDENKIAKTKLSPIFIDGIPTFSQAKYVLVCKKAYISDIKLENFVDDSTKKIYTDDNLHRQYIGVIEKVYKL